jgi:hypothetical protein
MFMIDNDFLKQLMEKAKPRSEKGSLTERQVINLLGKAWKAAESRLIEKVVPLIEFFPIQNPVPTGKGNWHIFSAKANSEFGDLQLRLQRAHGIYVFHDSSGRAIYAGKALRQLLWSEINHAFNKDRGEVQSIKRVDWPRSRVGRGDRENKQKSSACCSA